MLRKLSKGALAFIAVAAACAALAQAKFGTAEEAKTMLTKAVAAVKADKVKAIDMFIKVSWKTGRLWRARPVIRDSEGYL